MAVGEFRSTIFGGVTPVCNQCGVHLCWDISKEEYVACKRFWDNWICQECNGGNAVSLQHWRTQHPTFSIGKQFYLTLHQKIQTKIIGSGLSISDAQKLWQAGFLHETIEEAREALAHCGLTQEKTA